MQSKKIMITLASVCIAFVAVVTALVIVLVSGGQGATSNITVKFVATDVACEIEGRYERVNISAENTEQVYGIYTTMGSKLIINEDTVSGQLNPTGDIDLDKQYSRVVFEYSFTNTMLTSPMYIELTGMPDNDETNDPEGIQEELANINMLYYNTYNSQGALFSGVYDEELSTTMGKLVVPAQCTKYVYLVVTVASLTEDAEFTGQIEWTLTRGEKPTASYDDVGGKLTMTNIYEGCEVTESDLNHSTVNIRTLDWYTDTTVSAKAVFPITTTESTTLYSSYLKGNIAEENLEFNSTSRTITVKRNLLVTGATSTVAGYTPITATDTTLVIPDMFKLSDGRILPITYIYGVLDNSSLLHDNPYVTTLYVGNNVSYFDIPSSGGSVLRDIYMGIDIESIHTFVFANTSITNVYMTEGTTTDWIFASVGTYQSKMDNSVMTSSTALATYLKNMSDSQDIYRFYNYWSW